MKKLSVSNSIKGKRVTDVVFDTSGVRVYESGERIGSFEKGQIILLA